MTLKGQLVNLHRRKTMTRLGIFTSRLAGSNLPAAFLTRSTTAIVAAMPKGTAIAIKALCLTLSVLFVAATGTAQNSNSTTGGWVVLPVDEYRTLRRAALPIEAEPVPPPVEATLTRIDYDLKVDGDLASGEARLTVDVIKDGWVRLPLPNGLMVREARLDGRQV